MRWTPGGLSKNFEDRRGMGGGAKVGGAGLLVAVVMSLIFGKDFVSGLVGGGGGEPARPPSAEEARLAEFMSFMLDDQQATWRSILGERYQDAVLVAYDAERTPTDGCGIGEAAMGPFYCPADGKVYLDLAFFDEMERRLGAGGDFAQAYVLAHEIGHHVQNLTGSGRGRRSNAESVRQELQADCYAGVWGHHAAKKNMLEEGDLEEGLRAASAIGDDTLQKKAGRRVSPESFTHGSSEQRMTWLKRGFERGRPEDCDPSRDVASRR